MNCFRFDRTFQMQMKFGFWQLLDELVKRKGMNKVSRYRSRNAAIERYSGTSRTISLR